MESYKDSPFGKIPKAWKIVTVKDITKEHKQGFYTKDGYVDDGVRLVRITDLNNPTVDFSEMPMLNISDHDYENYKIEKGDFLFARSGAIGRYGIVESEKHPAVFASYLIRFRFNDNIVNRFFGYFFESYLCNNQLRGITQGNANVNINAENIKSLKFPLLPIQEQQKIADILSIVDAKIDIIDQQIKETQELKKGLMQRLLTKGIGHTEFKDSPLGRIPKSWEVVRLNQVGDIVTGTTPKTSVREYYTENGVLWASPADLGKQKYIESTNKQLTNLGFQQTRKLPPKSIMVTCIGSTIGKIGMTNSNMSTNQQINSIVCNESNCPEFYYYLIEKIAVYIKSLAGTQAVPLLNKTDFSAINVVNPPMQEQKIISEILKTLDEKTEILSEKKETYQVLKQGLMQQLLTGKIRVKV